MPAKIPPSRRVCDGAVLLFALWTLCCHATVAAGGSLVHLVGAYALALAGAAGAWLWLRRRHRTGPQPEAPPGGGPPPAASRALRTARIASLAAGIAGFAAVMVLRTPFALWWSVLAVLGLAAALFLLPEPARAEPPRAGRGPELVLFAIAVACAVVTAITHRPDLDDCFYVNVAVAAADDPSRALFSGDTMFGLPTLPLHMPAHRIHSFEVANGALAWLTGLPAIDCFHFVSALVGALLVPLAHAALFRWLTPRIWPWTVFAHALVLLATGETHRWYGNFAFVRMWQGKAFFLFVFLPLVYVYAIEFARRPSARRFAWLAAAQIAALGCSSSALWAGPAAALTGLCCVLRPNLAGLRTLALGALASVYVLGVGVILVSELQEVVAPVLEGVVESWQPGEPLADAFDTVLGDDRLAVFALFCLLVAWALQPRGRGLGQRFAIAVPLGAWLVLLNPYLAEWVSGHVTGPSYWRSMWALPIPTLLALVLVSPLHLPLRGRMRALGPLACVALLAAYAGFVPKFHALSERNGGAAGVGMRVGRPGLKVPENAYHWAGVLNAAVRPGSYVVAPTDVSPWIPTFHHHAYPLQPRRIYLQRQLASLGPEDVVHRRFLTRYVTGQEDGNEAAALFRWGLERFHVSGVLLRRDDRLARRVLRAAGFRRVLQGDGYEVWVR